MKRLYKIFLLFYVLGCTTVFAQFSWGLQHSGGIDIIKDIHFVNSNDGWAVGENGLILGTTDGGLTWNSQTASVSTSFHDVHFVNDQLGWIIANGGYVLKTTDGGASWFTSGIVGSSGTEGIYFVNDSIGWVSGWDGTVAQIFKTTDGGFTWVSQIVPTFNSIWKMDFENDQKGWGVGYSGVIHTDNGGVLWTVQNNPSGESLEDICMVNQFEGWAVGYNGAIIHTVDGGANWFTQTSGSTANLWDVDFIDAENGMVVGHNGEVLYTTNGGDNWFATSDFITSGVNFEALDMTDLYTAYIGGSNSKIYKSPLPENDLTVIAYHGLDTICADIPTQVILTIYNAGPGPINDANFVISDGATPVLFYQWSGNLAAGSYQDIDLGQITANNSGIFVCAIAGDSVTNNNISNKFIYVTPFDGGVSGPHHICPEEEVIINAYGGNSYYWFDASADSTAEYQTVQPTQNTIYNVAIQTTYCKVDKKVVVIIDDCNQMVTAISPNDDGVNDKLIIEEIVGYDNEVKIFNRWGDVVVSFTNYDNVNVVWDGKDENGKNLVETTYYYTYEAYEIGLYKSSWVQIVR